ncbi:hypothetical protein CDD83_66 [Cordyceps sp. RAO-2017]|nr:hypothetical protein CDD83_66 [Cordyceps sp. RAO-2017]
MLINTILGGLCLLSAAGVEAGLVKSSSTKPGHATSATTKTAAPHVGHSAPGGKTTLTPHVQEKRQQMTGRRRRRRRRRGR